MGGFRFEQCGNIEGLYLVEPQVFATTDLTLSLFFEIVAISYKILNGAQVSDRDKIIKLSGRRCKKHPENCLFSELLQIRP